MNYDVLCNDRHVCLTSTLRLQNEGWSLKKHQAFLLHLQAPKTFKVIKMFTELTKKSRRKKPQNFWHLRHDGLKKDRKKTKIEKDSPTRF